MAQTNNGINTNNNGRMSKEAFMRQAKKYADNLKRQQENTEEVPKRSVMDPHIENAKERVKKAMDNINGHINIGEIKMDKTISEKIRENKFLKYTLLLVAIAANVGAIYVLWKALPIVDIFILFLLVVIVPLVFMASVFGVGSASITMVTEIYNDIQEARSKLKEKVEEQVNKA